MNKRNGQKRKWKVASVVALAIIILIVLFGIFPGKIPADSFIVEANQQYGDLKYKVIEIQKGDSLWSIAQANASGEFSDIAVYVQEIKRCNQLNSNQIISGNYLMIPYYDCGQ